MLHDPGVYVLKDDADRRQTQGWLPLECESDLGVYNLSAETPTQNMAMLDVTLGGRKLTENVVAKQ